MDRISGQGNRVLGAVLILVGIVFLLGQFFDISLGRVAWPFFIIVPGLVIFVTALMTEEKAGEGLATVGSIVTMVGLILFYQNLTDHWESWAYAWALIAPTSIGIGHVIYGTLRGSSELVNSGLRMAGIGLVIFLIAAAFFELVIGISGRSLPYANLLWPLLLIGVGLLFLLRNLLPGVRGKQ